ncbi:MAG TPA: hypothetical protein EYQ20_01880 [candidate division Zixibacteria bacterium]|jgi:Ca-activated chloride channel family protein|nr:hypothetical protein [candidate division Zixibacteria bacterium]
MPPDPWGLAGGAVILPLPAPVLQFDSSDPMPVAFNREAYNPISENPFLATRTNPLSTFSIGLDAAFYSDMRRYIMDSQIPPRSM